MPESSLAKDLIPQIVVYLYKRQMMNAPNKQNREGMRVSAQDHAEIRQNLNLAAIATDAPENLFDWYTLTETSSVILTELIAYTAREEFWEMKKPAPDLARMERLWAFFKEVHAINREPANFKGASRMQAIIDTYAPMVREIYSKPAGVRLLP